MSLLINRRHPGADSEGEAIDLTERLAPYDGCAYVTRVEPASAAGSVRDEAPIREPLTSNAGYPTVGAPMPVLDVEPLVPSVQEAAPTPPSDEAAPGSIAVRRQTRNERCACGSGRKFKRCCLPRL